MDSIPEIDPDWAIRMTIILSWIMIALGGLKLILWIVGEFFPKTYEKLKSKGARKFLTGSGNRLVFGLLGLFTVLFGIFGLIAAAFMRWLMVNTPGL